MTFRKTHEISHRYFQQQTIWYNFVSVLRYGRFVWQVCGGMAARLRHGGCRWHGGGTVVSNGTVSARWCQVARWHAAMKCHMCMYCVTNAWLFQVGCRMELHWWEMPRAWVYRGMVVWSGMCIVCHVRKCTKVWLDGVRGGWLYGGLPVRIVKCMVAWRQKCTVARSTGDVAV